MLIERMLEGGVGYVVTKTEGGATFAPLSASQADMEAFQCPARQVIDNDGDGYGVFLVHRSNDLPGEIIDRIIITFE